VFASTLDSAVTTPISSLRSSLGDLRIAILEDKAAREAATLAAQQAQSAADSKAAAEQAFNTYAARLGNVDGTLVASEAQLKDLARAGGLSTSGSLADIGARVAGFSGSDNITSVVAGGKAIYDFLFNKFKAEYVPTTEAKYKAAYGLGASHYDQYGRAEILEGRRGFKPAAFDWSAIGVNIPGFASGGHHMGGIRLVGERGPELEVTGPARYFSNTDTKAMLGGDPSVLRDILRVLSEMQSLNLQLLLGIEKNTYDTAKINKRWNGSGVPTRDVA
jgi:hypothetical protein